MKIDAGAPGTAAAGTAGTAAVAGTAGMAAAAGTAKRDASHRTGEPTTGDTAMIRSEERMTVGTERHEAGRARLREYVVTEEETQTVPPRHEEVRIEREPITGKAREGTLRDAEISEDVREVTLHEDRPVTKIETVPVERVRLTTEEVVEQRTVKGEVRKEQIETVTDMDAEHHRR